jgi:succinate dehydrogenase hydrophobic anchor subunit
LACFSSNVIFIFLGVLTVLATGIMQIGMKDVIKDQLPEEGEKPKIKAVIKEAFHSLIH